MTAFASALEDWNSTSQKEMTVTVLIPTYNRPHPLGRCLTGLLEQDYPAHEVIVVTRERDTTSRVVAARSFAKAGNLKLPVVKPSGVIAAMNKGLSLATGDIVALTDDDAIPARDWLGRIVAAFAADARLGGLGGRDNVFINGVPEKGIARTVGQVSWHGRVQSGHHLGVGLAREVEVLKGVNCAFRAEPLVQVGFDWRMRGAGAQVHWELALCLALRRAGWRLLYDPSIIVNHYPAIRHDRDQRGEFNPQACRDAVHNETLTLLEHLSPLRRRVFLAWALIVGTCAAPGLVQALRYTFKGKKNALSFFKSTCLGRLDGWNTYRQTK